MKVVALFSGGLDSTVLLYYLLNEGHEVTALSFDYGQRHRRELQSAEAIAKKLNIDHKVLNLSELSQVMRGSSQTDEKVEVPEGHYESDNMAITVVPNRNMILLSIAAAEAISQGGNAIAYAAHNGDHRIYADCREDFVLTMEQTLSVANEKRMFVLTPFIKLRKDGIVKMGYRLGVPFHLTWSCYKGENAHCGVCGTCCERIESFKLAGVSDPTEYA